MSALPVDSQLDLQLLALLNLIAEPIAGDVTANAAQVGRLYRNTSTSALMYVRNATTVVRLDVQGLIATGDIAAAAGIKMTQLELDPRARSSHTGTQVAATISDFAAAVTAFRLDQMAKPTASIDMNGQKAINQADGTATSDSATWGQVQNLVSSTKSGQDWKDSAVVALTVNVNIASPGALSDTDANGTYTVAVGDRVLLVGQTTATQNGLYTYNGSAAAMTRTTDADANAEVTPGLTVPVERGANASSLAILTTPGPITIGTTALTFTFLKNAGAYTAGQGISIAGGIISLIAPVTVALGGTGATTASGARANLGVPQKGYAADLGAITAGGSVDVVHGLGTQDVHVGIYEKATGRERRFLDVTRKSADPTNTVTVSSAVAFAAAALRIVVVPIA